MPIRDLLKKKDKHSHDEDASEPNPPEFTFLRSTTNTQEIIAPPTYPADTEHLSPESDHKNPFSRFKSRSRAVSAASASSSQFSENSSHEKGKDKDRRRLSHRLGIRKELPNSDAVPDDLPTIQDVPGASGEHVEGQWELRATALARENEKRLSRPGTPSRSLSSEKIVATKATDDNIQEAIRLHEDSKLEQATAMFGRLADFGGENNALSQVLYGLALRHGWGCTADPQKAMTYLSAAAANAASIEDLALRAGSQNGGEAKGELVLAIFELANSFRHGWGVKKDPVAAKQYYETAANLGDTGKSFTSAFQYHGQEFYLTATDAMNEVGWCYLEGFGCKKDKMASAKYYRLAEKGGNKTLGNTWIWKPKYDPK